MGGLLQNMYMRQNCEQKRTFLVLALKRKSQTGVEMGQTELKIRKMRR